MRLDDPDLPNVSAEQIEAGRNALMAGLSRDDDFAWIAHDLFCQMTLAGKEAGRRGATPASESYSLPGKSGFP